MSDQGKMRPERAAPFVTILDTRIDNLSMSEVLDQVEKLVSRSTASHIITANVDHLMVMRNDLESAEIYRRSVLVVADGVPLLWASRFLGPPLQERINGTDLMERICALAAEKKFSVFLLGAQEGIAAEAGANLQRQFPGLIVSGTYAPYHGFENDDRENEKIFALLRKKKPDILFSSLGFPKGIKWIDRHQNACAVAVAIEVGASFMFLSSRARRAPRWMQKAGLEWLWRLAHEPRRLWKRYLLNDLSFFYHLFKQKYSKEKPAR